MVWFHQSLCGQLVYMDKCRELCIWQPRAPSWWKESQVSKCFSCMSAVLNEYSQGGQTSCLYMSHLNIFICLGATKHISHPSKSSEESLGEFSQTRDDNGSWGVWVDVLMGPKATQQCYPHEAHSLMGEPCPVSGLLKGWVQWECHCDGHWEKILGCLTLSFCISCSAPLPHQGISKVSGQQSTINWLTHYVPVRVRGPTEISEKCSALKRLRSAIKNPQNQMPNRCKYVFFWGKKSISLSFYEKRLISEKKWRRDERKIPTLLKRPDLQPINICRVRYAHVQWNITSLLHTHADTNTDTQTHGRSLCTSPTQPPPMQTPTNSQPNFRHMPLDSVPRPPQSTDFFSRQALK